MGKKLAVNIKQLLFQHFQTGIKSKALHKRVFLGKNDIISKNYVKKLFTFFKNHSDNEINEFINKNTYNELDNMLSHGNKKFKRKSKYHLLRDEFLLFEKQHHEKDLKVVIRAFNVFYYGVNYDRSLEGLNETTCRRWLKEAKISTKVAERRHIRRCKVQGYHYMRLMEHVRKQQIISTDAMATGDKYMSKRTSRSPVGEPAFLPQFVIGDRTFSLIASVCYLGILCWKIYEDSSVNGDDVYVYLRDTLEPYLENHHFGIFDNAKVQKKNICVIEMERIFTGKYAFISPYSPHFNPIERVFSLIRRYLRDNEQYAVLHPVEALNDACKKYSVNGTDGEVCGEFFNLYENNYELAHI